MSEEGPYKGKPADPLKRYRTCPQCNNEDLDWMVFGGIGDWRDKVVCGKCFKITSNVDFEKIKQLVAEQTGYTPDEVDRAQAKADEDYERLLFDQLN